MIQRKKVSKSSLSNQKLLTLKSIQYTTPLKMKDSEAENTNKQLSFLYGPKYMNSNEYKALKPKFLKVLRNDPIVNI